MFASFNAFRTRSAANRKKIEQLQALVAAAREERQALSVMLTEVTTRSRQLTEVSTALRRMEQESAGTRERLAEVAAALAGLQQTATACADLDSRVRQLVDQVAAAQLAAQNLAGVDEQVLHRREELQRLSSQLQDARRAVATLAGSVRPPRVMTVRLAGGIAGWSAAALLVGYIAAGGERPVTSSAGMVASTAPAAVTKPVAASTAEPAVAASSAQRAIAQPRTRTARRAPAGGQLRVTSVPSGARVTVNGVGRGVTPVTIRRLPLGEKRVRVSKDGYRSQEWAVRLTRGDPERSLELELRNRTGAQPRRPALTPASTTAFDARPE